MRDRVIPLRIGCKPSPAVPAETVIRDPDSGAHLLFLAVTEETSARGHLEDLGVAIVRSESCIAVRFGYPNDEGAQEHPLYERGWSESASSIMEVVQSSWADDLEDMKQASTQRIWSGRGFDPSDASRFPPVDWRHYLFALREITFEALATGHQVTFAPDWKQAVRSVLGAAA